MALTDAAISADGVAVAVLFFADFADLPVRGCYSYCPLYVPPGLADVDADCAGFTFPTIDSDVLQVGNVTHADGGTDTLAFILNTAPDSAALLSAIEDVTVYAGRAVRVWLVIHDAAGTVLSLRPIYRGYMTVPSQQADATRYVITMQAENFDSLLAEPQFRTYLNSKKYDGGDLSDVASKGMTQGVPGVPGGGGAVRYDQEPRHQP